MLDYNVPPVSLLFFKKAYSRIKQYDKQTKMGDLLKVRLKLYHLTSQTILVVISLTLKAPITTVADDNFCNIVLNFRKKV